MIQLLDITKAAAQMLKEQSELGDELCKWCPLDKKGVYHVPGGFMAGCEGSRCKEAYEFYAEECAGERENIEDLRFKI